MKKEIFSISEKYERITIRYKQKRKSSSAVCENCKKHKEWMTIDEAASLFGTDTGEIKQNLITLRKKNKLIN